MERLIKECKSIPHLDSFVKGGLNDELYQFAMDRLFWVVLEEESNDREDNEETDDEMAVTSNDGYETAHKITRKRMRPFIIFSCFNGCVAECANRVAKCVNRVVKFINVSRNALSTS